MMIPILIIVLILALFAFWIRNIFAHINALPANSPSAILSKQQQQRGTTKPLFVCLGDSNTHATVAHSYIEILERSALGEKYSFINAGVNGDLAWNALQRLDGILALNNVACISILCGTNDFKALVHESIASKSVEEKNLPQPPTEAFFDSSMRQIIKKIRASAKKTKIFVLDLPPLGEGGDQSIIERANRCIRKIVADAQEQEGGAVKLVTVYDALRSKAKQLRAERRLPPALAFPRTASALFKAIALPCLCRYCLFREWDEIGSWFGNTIMTGDALHINETAAKIVAERILEAAE